MTDATPSPDSTQAPVFRHREPLRVRWAEIDAQQIVFNGHYLMYADTAMAGYWRALALPYAETMAALGGDLFVRQASLDYRASAVYDDLLEVGLRCHDIGRSSLRFEAMVYRQAEALVGVKLVYVFADPVARRALPVPEVLRKALLGFERGEPAWTVAEGSWEQLGPQAQSLRHAVFVQEQGIPAELEWDASDATARHVLAVNTLGLPVGTGRLLPHRPGDPDGAWRIGRMAVRRELRGSGVGRSLVQALWQAAQAQGARQLRLHAQASAVGFYKRLGFHAEGPMDTEAGIPHQTMARNLADGWIGGA